MPFQMPGQWLAPRRLGPFRCSVGNRPNRCGWDAEWVESTWRFVARHQASERHVRGPAARQAAAGIRCAVGTAGNCSSVARATRGAEAVGPPNARYATCSVVCLLSESFHWSSSIATSREVAETGSAPQSAAQPPLPPSMATWLTIAVSAAAMPLSEYAYGGASPPRPSSRRNSTERRFASCCPHSPRRRVLDSAPC